MKSNETDDSLMNEKDSSADEAEPPGPQPDICLQEPLVSLPLNYTSPSPPRRRPMIVSERSKSFLRQFFPGTGKTEWEDWQWQIKNSITSLSELQRIVKLEENEIRTWTEGITPLPLRITPYYAGLISTEDSNQPLRKCVIPCREEMIRNPGEDSDPLHEESHCPTRGLIHRYPDRVLFMVSGFCATYCRYCTRSRLLEDSHQKAFSRQDWERCLTYIALNPAIRDVLISGGDPLTLADDEIEYLLHRLQQIPHLEFLRIGTKVPVVLPQRITPRLVSILKKVRPLWLSIHFTHPAELTPECSEACQKLADAGLPLGSQTVLLKGVNDDLQTMKALMHGLLRIRVRPYYLYQCDPVSGSGHFRTQVAKGLEIIAGLRGHTSGYAVPHFVIDAPGGGGKIPLLPQYSFGQQGHDLLLQNYQGKLFRYPEPYSA